MEVHGMPMTVPHKMTTPHITFTPIIRIILIQSTFTVLDEIQFVFVFFFAFFFCFYQLNHETM